MRDILEDAENAIQRGDVGPGKVNRERDTPRFPTRFYKSVSVRSEEGGFSIRLDERAVKTPGRADLVMPTSIAAQLVADEWQAVENEINPFLMPVTRLANTVIDGVANEMQPIQEDITRYAASDLVCYRADTPEGLVEMQHVHWDRILDWMEQEIGARFLLAEGVVHIHQPKSALTAFGVRLRAYDDPFKLACIHVFTVLCGSALIALVLAEGVYSAQEAWQAAHVDEDWNIALWGEDSEAAQRRKQRWKDFEAAHKLFSVV